MQKRESRPNRKTISEPFGIFQKLQINFLAYRHMLVNTSKKNFEKMLKIVGARVGELILVLCHFHWFSVIFYIRLRSNTTHKNHDFTKTSLTKPPCKNCFASPNLINKHSNTKRIVCRSRLCNDTVKISSRWWCNWPHKTVIFRPKAVTISRKETQRRLVFSFSDVGSRLRRYQ